MPNIAVFKNRSAVLVPQEHSFHVVLCLSSEAEETLSTLRFASSVKKIKTVAKVNVDHKDQQISSLQNEVDDEYTVEALHQQQPWF